MKKERTFEQGISRLEEIVSRFDMEDLPLEEAIKLYEEGVLLAGFCGEQLKSAQQKITELDDKLETKN